MPYWKSDKELFALVRQELNTALLGDIMDQLGYYHQFLSPCLKPLDPHMLVIGRAMPVLEADIDLDDIEYNFREKSKKPFGLMFEALDDLKEDEVYICSGSSSNYALWGELMSTRALKLSAAGAVVNGYSRDTHGILRLNFPTFSLGTYAQDQKPRGEVVDFRIPIKWDSIRIEPGTIVFGDRDGVIVIPRDMENEAFTGAIEKARAEKRVSKALRQGMSSVDAFNRFGVM
jgi:regulator of RNase E activity RraA